MKPFKLIRLAYLEDLDKDPEVTDVISRQAVPWILASGGDGWTKEFMQLTKLKQNASFGNRPGDLAAYIHQDAAFHISPNSQEGTGATWGPNHYKEWYNPRLNLLYVEVPIVRPVINHAAVREFLGKMQVADIKNLDDTELPRDLVQ